MQLNYQTNAPLAAGSQYIGAWQSVGTGPSGVKGKEDSRYVRITSFSDQPGTLALYQADSPTGLFGAGQQVDQVAVSGNCLGVIEAVVTGSYWQAIYTNGSTAQKQFQHYAFSTPDMDLAIWQQLVQLNQQLLALRGPKDSTKYDQFNGIR